MRTTPLIQAVQSGHMPLIGQLIRGGAEVNAINAWGRTAAHYAVSRDNQEALNFLLDNGADANLADNDGNTPLDMWHKHKHKNEKILELLHAAGARTSPTEAEEQQSVISPVTDTTPSPEDKVESQDLWQAAANNDRASAERLLAAGAHAKAENDAGKVPFDIAIEAEHYELAAVLLKAAVGINGRDKKGWTPLHWAIFGDAWDLVREFIREGADLYGGSHQNAFDVATLMKSEAKLVEAFIAEKGVDVNVGQYTGETMLMLTARKGNIESAELLINHKADLNIMGAYGKTALAWALQYKNIDIVKLLVKHKADLNIQDMSGRTALTWATFNKDIKIVEFLIDHGANVNLPNNYGSTALTWAADNGDTELTELLIEHGAKVNAQNRHGDSALLLTAKKGDTPERFKIAELLIEKHADVNAQNRYGETPLMAAALSKQPKTIELLIKHGAKVNAQNDHGGTALTRAAHFGYTKIVKLLIENGADPSLKLITGKTALDLAEENGHKEIIAILQEAQKNIEQEGKSG